MTPMKDLGMVAEAGFWKFKVEVSIGDDFINTSRIEIPKLHAHFYMIKRKSINFQMNLMKGVGEVVET